MHTKHKKWNKKDIRLEAKKYKFRSDFHKNNHNAYTAAIRLNILEEVCAHMKRKNEKKKFTKSYLIKIARKFESKKDFEFHFQKEYRYARKNNMLQDICSHMRNPCLKWTKEKLKEKALKYQTRGDFKKGDPRAYNAALRRGLMDDISIHMVSYRDKVYSKNEIPPMCRKFSENEIKKIAEKYTLSEFRKETNLFNIAKKRNLLEKIYPEYKKRKKRYSKKELLLIAKKYSNKHEFRIKEKQAYNSCCYYNILEEACSHMKKRNQIKVKRAIYAFEFPDKSVYIGLTHDYNIRYRNHMKKHKTIINKTNKMGHIFIMFNEFYSEKEAAKKEKKLIQEYKVKGWSLINKNKGGSLGYIGKLWTKDRIFKEARKYKYRYEFAKSSGAYKAAIRMGILQEVCSHMEYKNRKITKKEILKEAKKYKTRTEFLLNSNKYYNWAKKYDILDSVCSHMKIIRKKRTNEDLINSIKKYKSKKEFRENDYNTYSVCLYRRKTEKRLNQLFNNLI